MSKLSIKIQIKWMWVIIGNRNVFGGFFYYCEMDRKYVPHKKYDGQIFNGENIDFVLQITNVWPKYSSNISRHLVKKNHFTDDILKDDIVRYSKKSLGINKLKTLMKTICDQDGLDR